MARRLIRALAAFGLLLGCAHAGEFHFETFRYGQRAMGMAGAVTGQPFEPEASYYNPAGLALLDRGARFSGALNFFGLDRRLQKGGLRDGGLFAPGDLESKNFLPTPSGSVISTTFAQRHAIAFSTFLLGDLSEDYVGAQDATVVGDPFFDGVRFNSSFKRRDRLQLRGLTYAYTPDRRWSFGVSAFWLEHRREEIARRAQILGADDVEGNLFLDVSNEEKTTTHSLLARIGIAWRPNERASYGAACTLPTLPLTGESTYGYIIITSGDLDREPPAYVSERESVDAQTQLPVNCRLGAARRLSSKWLLSADLSLYLPVSYDRFEFSADTQNSEEEFAAGVDTDTTINLAVGAEYQISPRWPIRFGVFTNRTTAPEIDPDPVRFAAPHVDLYGATFSAGYLGDRRSINLGLEVQYGQGHDVVSEGIDSLVEFVDFSRVEREEWRVVIFIAGAASFAKDTAVDIIKPVFEGDTPAR